MASGSAVVAILVSNPALSALLAATLAGSPSLRIRPFESEVALVTYMRLAPVDMLVVDLDDAVGGERLCRRLRADTQLDRRDFQVIALSARIDAALRAASLAAGIDEVLVKPMSPRYLLERVLARLTRRPAPAPAPDLPRRAPPRQAAWPANVVPLFPGLQPQG